MILGTLLTIYWMLLVIKTPLTFVFTYLLQRAGKPLTYNSATVSIKRFTVA